MLTLRIILARTGLFNECRSYLLRFGDCMLVVFIVVVVVLFSAIISGWSFPVLCGALCEYFNQTVRDSHSAQYGNLLARFL